MLEQQAQIDAVKNQILQQALWASVSGLLHESLLAS
jgi:hypothetical protein